MKVLMLTSSLDTGGAETHIYSLARGLVGEGAEVWVASSGGRLAERLSEDGITHLRVRFELKRPLRSLIDGIRLYGLVKKEGFDLLHAHTRPAAYLLYWISKGLHIPFITTLHARFSLFSPYRAMSRWGYLTIAVSEDLRQYLCDNYSVSAENTRVIENGIDTLRFHPKSEARVTRRIAFASRLDRDCSEGAFALCRISERIFDAYPDAEIVICGGGDRFRQLSRVADEINGRRGKGAIRLMGQTDSVEKIMQSADVFVGVSRAALEAMSCGALTVLAGNEGFLGLIDGEDKLSAAAESNFCCRGCDKLTDDALYEAMLRAFRLTPDEREELSALAVRYVRENNGADRMVEGTLKVYREAMRINPWGRGQIILAGYYGYGNMGDNALLRATVKRARLVYGGRRITALTKRPRRDVYDFGIRCVDRMNILAVLRELHGAEALIFGGGTLLQDGTSLRSLVYYTALLRMAALKGLRIELWGNGLASPRTSFAAYLIKRAISDAHYVGLRDFASATEALRVVEPRDGDKLYYERDLAVSQKPSPPLRIEYLFERLGLKSDGRLRKYAIIAVRGSSGRGYVEMLERWIRELIVGEILPVFLPMFPKEDLEESERLCDCFGGVVARSLSEGDAVGLMRGSAVVGGMRLHALVFALAANAPFIGFGGDPKVESFCRENGGTYFTDLTIF